MDIDAAVAHLRKLAAGASPLRSVNTYLSSLPRAALVADDGGHYIGANESACVLTGLSREELLQRSVADLTPPEDMAVEEILWNAFVRVNHQQGVYALLCKDGRIAVVEYDAYANIGPGIHVSFLVARPEPGPPPGPLVTQSRKID